MWSAAHPTCISSSQCGHDRACIFHESGFGDISHVGQYNPDEPGECKNCVEIYALHEEQGEYSVHYVPGQVAKTHVDGNFNFTHVVELKSLQTGEVADPGFRCLHDDSVCQGCFSPNTHTFSTRSPDTTTLNAMRRTDVLTLVLTSMVAAAYMAGELNDARLCIIGAIDSNATQQWKLFFGLIYGVRRFGTTSGLMIAIFNVLLYHGCDSMSICFNTL